MKRPNEIKAKILRIKEELSQTRISARKKIDTYSSRLSEISKVARLQKSKDAKNRAIAAFEMRQSGMKFKEIAEKMKVSTGRARQISNKGESISKALKP